MIVGAREIKVEADDEEMQARKRKLRATFYRFGAKRTKLKLWEMRREMRVLIEDDGGGERGEDNYEASNDGLDSPVAGFTLINTTGVLSSLILKAGVVA